MPALARSAVATVNKLSATRENLRKSLLNWYDCNGRDLPWRVRGGRAEPYRVWLSEVMLQQTTVAAVGPYFAKFLERWPNVAALAAAPRDAVLEAWAGLGYYSRARNLHAAAQILARDGFPRDEPGWRKLPGVGAYTAAAIAAIAFDEATNVVDGNVERVIARLRAVATPLPDAKAELRECAGALVTGDRPGDWAQALMDLGATICAPKAPKCSLCPWRETCAAFAAGAPETYPRRAAKAARPERFGVVFRAERDGAIWLVRRPDKGLFGGMAALPTTEWRGEAWSRAEALRQAPVKAKWRRIGAVRHAFTHFALTLDVYAAEANPTGDGWWDNANALPTAFKKAAELERGPSGPLLSPAKEEEARLKTRAPRRRR
ncbi:MAG: A/G-specific adenine glycosylase [Proteobacteria bacterium]|nr:A/G-specific adenine glycosylase [Pseudomonadota bacterium]